MKKPKKPENDSTAIVGPNPEALATAAESRFSQIQKIVKLGWYQLGKILKEGMARKDYETLGYANARAWMEAATFGSLSGAWKSLRIAKALDKLPEETVMRMTEGKADLLTRLPESERDKSEWIEKAIDPEVSNKEFKEIVMGFFDTKQGIKAEPFVDFGFKIPLTAYERVFLPAENKAARLLNVDIEQFPAKRLQVWEQIALFILVMEDERFLEEAEGKHVQNA